MTTIVFTDEAIEPSADLIEVALGRKSVHWQNICAYLVKLGDIQQGWTFYGKRNGWLLKSELKGRNLFFFVPGQNEFSLTYTFGKKAFNFILTGDFPESVTEPLRNARKYAEGRVLRFPIENNDDCQTARRLIDVKVSH